MISKKLKKLWKIATRRAYAMAAAKGVAAAGEHERVLARIPLKMVVDVGANRGQFAVVARHCAPKARIVAFEPLSAPGEIFERVFSNDENVQLCRVAIGSQPGEHTIHVSARDDSSSLLPITSKQVSCFPGTEEKSVERVRVARMNEFVSVNDIQRPALLKLDVQGYELEALQGSEDVLDAFDVIYVECSFMELYEGQPLASDVIAYLYQRRFVLDGVYNVKYDRDGVAVQADFLFAMQRVGD
jgi:FkbM family methyltransferase